MKNLVSIITPAFQAEASLAAAVQSVISQTHTDWEMLIVSDDQQDYERILAEQGIRDSRLRFFSTGNIGSGPNITRNVALERVQGDWVAPLDADDVYFPERLESLLNAGKASGLALDNIRVVGQSLAPYTALAFSATDKFSFPHVKSSLVPLLFLFHHRHITHGWDEDVVRGADTLFNLRAMESAGFASFVEVPLHEYRVHDKSMCHAPGSEDLFQQSYAYTLKRLREDGLGFTTLEYRENMIVMLEEKRQINQDFALAVTQGFEGNYQSFVQQRQIKI